MPIRKAVSIAIPLLVCAGMSGSATVLAGDPPQPAPTQAELPSLRITSQVTLPPELKTAKDLRWAGDNSVYLALGAHGASEVSLDPPGQPLREMIPGRFKPGGFFVAHQVAVSPQYFAVSAFALAFTWRRFDDVTRTEAAAEFIQAIDLWKDRLLLVGARRDGKGNFASDGAIAWIGSLDKKLTDLKPLVYAATGSGAREMNACGNVHLGAARFFTDGSFVILPGVQPGLALYDPAAKLLKTWDTTSLGIDSDCGSLIQAQVESIAVDYAARMAWVNQRRTVDTILPLSSGPGLVIRSVENGRARWRLDILKTDGKIESYKVPIDAPDEFYHLRGDVQSGKIVFLLFQTPASDRNHAQPHLITALLPEGSYKQ